MKVGLLLGSLDHAASLGELAAFVEELGFDSIWAGDHVSFPAPILDPLEVLACYAVRTSRVLLGTCVYLLPLRHPTPVAKMTSSLDFLAGGRFVFGVGVGGEFPAEFAACEVSVRERGARADEAIDLLRLFWRGEKRRFEGRFFRLETVPLEPRSPRPAGPPVWVGGRSDAALRRAARRGDGYVGYLLDPPKFRARMEKIREMAGDRPVTGALLCFSYVDDDRESALAHLGAALGAMYGRPMEEAAARYCVAGPREAFLATLEAYRDAGVEHLVLAPMASGARLREQIEKTAELVRSAQGASV
ncbi:MAG: N5,N10-methylene tetrahydromethanopterin reductase [Candidatus Binatia bacterium]|nr:MAG: N5,N10-methylene tetrahydromethanopterin reductase [Candidatus Binatia bacterium]